MNDMIHIRELNARDPMILPYPKENKYFLYSNKRVIPGLDAAQVAYYESDDLIWWMQPKLAYRNDEDFWGPLDYWAPEVHEWQGKYYLFCSYRAAGGYRRCQCHVADTPRGPFLTIKNAPVTPDDWQCLDGTLYVDRQSKPWMIFCHEWPQVQDGQMVAIPLNEDLGDAIGDPVILFRASEAPWKGKPGDRGYPKGIGCARITDGPFLYRAQNGELLMLWSSFAPTGYAVGYARSLSGEIQGPWKQEEEPLYDQDGGHAMLFHDLRGKLVMTLHTPNRSGEERLLLFDMEDSNGHLHIINERTGNWLVNRYYPDGSKKK